MNNKENQLIFEKYLNNGNQVQNLNEGLIDRIKSKAAGAVGAVRGMGQQVSGTVKGAVAGAKGNVAGVKQAAQQVQQGKTAGPVAKVESYRNTAVKKFDKVSNEVFTDLQKLGINLDKMSPQSLNNFKNNLNKAFDEVVNNIKGVAGTAKPKPRAAATAKPKPRAAVRTRTP